MLADLQTHLNETLAELKAHEGTIAELAQALDKHRSNQVHLGRRLAALEDRCQTTLDELRASRQRHQQHLTRLEHSVEAQKHAVSELDQILNAHEQ